MIDLSQILSLPLGSTFLQSFELSLVISFSQFYEGFFDRIRHDEAQVDYEIKSNAVDKWPSHQSAHPLILDEVCEAHKVVVRYGDKYFVKLFEKAHGLRNVAVWQAYVYDHEGHAEVGEKNLEVPVFFQQQKR